MLLMLVDEPFFGQVKNLFLVLSAWSAGLSLLAKGERRLGCSRSFSPQYLLAHETAPQSAHYDRLGMVSLA